MSMIDYLDEAEISSYRKLSSSDGPGSRMKKALEQYDNRMVLLRCNGFGADDESRVGDSIDLLRQKAGYISEAVADMDILIDNLIYILDSCIIEKEKQLAREMEEA